MTRALVTGASGFIGAHVVRALLEDGVDTRVLLRASSHDRNVAGLKVERAEGDIRDEEAVAAAMRGVDVLFHVAALYELAVRDRAQVFAVNVGGTRVVMRAALRAGVQRVVHTSSVAAIGHAEAGGAPSDGRQRADQRQWPDERQWADPQAAAGPYEETKILSERLVHSMVERDALPAVIVNPTAPIGPLDIKPTPTGRLIENAAAGRMPGYLRSAGLNLVDVRDVARGHLLAWRKGRIGERYILGNAHGNLPLREVIARAARAGERRRPLLPLPYPVALAFAQLDERLLSRALRRRPRVPIAGVRLARRPLWFDPAKAIDELELPQSPIEIAMRDAVAFFTEGKQDGKGGAGGSP